MPSVKCLVGLFAISTLVAILWCQHAHEFPLSIDFRLTFGILQGLQLLFGVVIVVKVIVHWWNNFFCMYERRKQKANTAHHPE